MPRELAPLFRPMPPPPPEMDRPLSSPYRSAGVDLFPPWSPELEVATAAIRCAAQIGQSIVQDADKGSVEKDDLSPVTVADFAIQAMLTHTIRNAFPDDRLVGEEDSRALRENKRLMERVWRVFCSGIPGTDSDTWSQFVTGLKSEAELCDLLDACGGANAVPSSTGRTWVFDPIDGTKAFLRGELYAINVALLENGKQTLSVVGLPNFSVDPSREGPLLNSCVDRDPRAKGSLIFACRGQGTWIKPLHINIPGFRDPEGEKPRRLGRDHTDGAALESLRLAISFECADSGIESVHRAVAEDLKMEYPGSNLISWVLRWAAMGMGLANATIWVYKSRSRYAKAWDHAGAMLLFEEVGGKITDLDGWPIDLTAGREMSANFGFVGAPEKLHRQVLGRVRNVLRREIPELLRPADNEKQLEIAKGVLQRAAAQLAQIEEDTKMPTANLKNEARLLSVINASAVRRIEERIRRKESQAVSAKILHPVAVKDLEAAKERVAAAEKACSGRHEK